MFDLFINAIVCVLFTIPGMLIVSAFKYKYSLKVSFLDTIVLGAIFWQFILVVPSMYLGVFASHCRFYFLFYTILSVVCLVCLGIALASHNRRPFECVSRLISLLKDRPSFFMVALGLSLQPFLFFITWAHSMYLEYDAVAVYFPIARSIVLSGGFDTNFFRIGLPMTSKLPALPIAYAWVFATFGGEYFRLVPYGYFVLTSIVTYSICRELFPKTMGVGLLSFSIFSVLPATVATLSHFSLYLEPALLFYYSLGILCSIKAIKEGRRHWYFWAGLAACMCLLTKETGVFLGLMIVVLLLLVHLSSRRLRCLASPCVLLPLMFFAIADLATNSRTVVFKVIPIVFLWVALVSLIPKQTLPQSPRKFLAPKSCLFLLLPFLSSSAWFLHNWLNYGFPLHAYPQSMVTRAQPFLQILNLSQDQLWYEEMFSYLRFDLLFSACALGSLFLVPKIIGMYEMVVKQKDGRSQARVLEVKSPSNASRGHTGRVGAHFVANTKMMRSIKEVVHRYSLFVFLCGILFYLMIWCFIYGCRFSQDGVRSLYMMSSFISIVIAYGIFHLCRYFGIRRNHWITIAFLFCEAFLIVQYLFQLDFVYYGSYGLLSHIQITENVLTSSSFIFVCLWFFLLVAHKAEHKYLERAKSTFVFLKQCRKKLFSLILLVVLCLSIFFPLYLLSMVTSSVGKVEWNLKIYRENSWGSPLGDAIEYFQNISDDYVTLGYFIYELNYFANRSIIDVSTPSGIYAALTFLECNNASELVELLSRSHIAYFLLPNAAHQRFSDFERLYNRTLLFALAANTEYTVLLKNLQQFNLYKLI